MSLYITIIKLNTIHLYLDNLKNIMYFDILNNIYSKEDSINLLLYFKNFWILANELNKKYFIIIKLKNIGIYPLEFYQNLISNLNSLNEIFKTNLNSCAFLVDEENSINMLKPLFNIYKFVRPFKICNSNEEIFMFFNKNYLN
jgi:hypothetical protein